MSPESVTGLTAIAIVLIDRAPELYGKVTADRRDKRAKEAAKAGDGK